MRKGASIERIQHSVHVLVLMLLCCGSVLLGGAQPGWTLPHQPDLWIRNAADNSFTGVGIFSTDGVNQTKTQSVVPGQTAVFLYRVQNSDTTANSFTLTATAGSTGLAVQYLLTDTNLDITSQITAPNGFAFGKLAPGASLGFYARVTPATTTHAGTNFTLTIKAISVDDTTVVDTVRSVVTVMSPLNFQPDLWIRAALEAGFSGIGILSTDGLNQTKTQDVVAGKTDLFFFRVENAGLTADSFRLTATAGNSAFNVQYFLTTNNTDITSSITSANGLLVGPLNRDAVLGFYVKVTPTATTPLGTLSTLIIKATSVADAAKVDVVRAVSKVITDKIFQPDLLLRNSSQPQFSGEEVFSTDGLNQTATQTIAADKTAVFLFRVENEGFTGDTFRLTATAGNSAVNVRYFLTSFDVDITAKITGPGGILVGPLTPEATLGFYAKVSLANTTMTGTTGEVLTVKAFSLGDTSKSDVVRAVTNFTSVFQPDLLIRSSLDSKYSGEGIFNTTGLDQTRSQMVLAGQTATFLFKVKNAGGTTDSFLITALSDNADTTVKFSTANASSTTFTQQIFGSGFRTGPLAPGATFDFFVQMQTSTCEAFGSSTNLQVIASSLTDPTKKDVVRAIAKITATFQPDLWLKTSQETEFSGVAVFSTNSANQTKSQTITAGTTTTDIFRIVNAGNAPDTFTINVDASNLDSTVRFFRSDTQEEITPMIFGNGFFIGPLPVGAGFTFYAQVTPSTTSKNAVTTVTVHARSQSDINKVDVVRTITTAVPPTPAFQPDLWIRNPRDTTYTGAGIFSTTGVEETISQNIGNGQTASYLIQVDNAGASSDSYKLTGTASTSLWGIRYFDVSTGDEITAAITTNGLTTQVLAPGAKFGVLLEVTSHVTPLTQGEILVVFNAVSTNANGKIDVVRADTVSRP